MEVTFIEDKKNSITFTVTGVSHGFCNLLKEELAKDSNVKMATYRIDHPLVGIPRFKVEGTNPKSSLKKAIRNLSKEIESFKTQSKKLK